MARQIDRWSGDFTPLSSKAPASATAEQLDNTSRQLQWVQQQIAATGVNVVLLALPTDAAAPAGFGSHESGARNAYSTLTSALTHAGVPMIDSYPAIAADIALGNDPYSDWDPYHHFNVRGHRLVADALSQYLTQHPRLGLRIRKPDARPETR
jgi:lysophospholipase L1-like esterase